MSATSKCQNGKRKEDHLRINLSQDVQFRQVTSGLEKYRFVHQALPELDACSIDLSTALLGKRLKAPLLISPMVGGINAAGQINRNLALAAQTLRVAMGVGSQRAAIDDPSVAATYHVRDIAPDILLLANLGAVQLNNGYSISECRRAIEMIGADGLILHLNPLQEALQQDGNTNFSGVLRKIERACRELPCPVIVKEVGWGISENVARQLAQAGVAAIDVAGVGGTSWSEVERHRAGSDSIRNMAGAFASWGIPTAESIVAVRPGAPELTLIGSGGIRTGVDVAKAIALGSHAAGMAAPLLKAAFTSAESVITEIRRVLQELRIAMFCSGVGSIAQLRESPRLQKVL